MALTGNVLVQLRDAAQDQVFFSAEAGTPGQGLWTSDGTEEGTVLVKDIRTGTAP